MARAGAEQLRLAQSCVVCSLSCLKQPKHLKQSSVKSNMPNNKVGSPAEALVPDWQLVVGTAQEAAHGCCIRQRSGGDVAALRGVCHLSDAILQGHRECGEAAGEG
jgi:hypothetical protein